VKRKWINYYSVQFTFMKNKNSKIIYITVKKKKNGKLLAAVVASIIL